MARGPEPVARVESQERVMWPQGSIAGRGDGESPTESSDDGAPPTPDVQRAPMLHRIEELPSLLGMPITWRLLGWWTFLFGALSWLAEWGFSLLDPAGQLPFWFSSNRFVYAVVWSGAIVTAIVATERMPVTSRRQVARIAAHVVFSLVVAGVWGVAAYYLCLAIVPGWIPMGPLKMLAATTKIVLFGYGLVVVLVHIVLRVRLQQRQEVWLLERARHAAEAELAVLKLEIQPHFLFNALNTVSALIHSDPDAANDTLVLVSRMLRQAVERRRVQEVSLREELEGLRLYVELQTRRYPKRLRLAWRIDPGALDASVPDLLLQPLVENAIKHGLEARSDAGRIEIEARREGDALLLAVTDDGHGPRQRSPNPGTGVGLANVRSRLAQLYGDAQAFTIGEAPGGGARVEIRIPYAESRSSDARPEGDAAHSAESSPVPP